MGTVERLKKLLSEATVPYSKPSIVFKDNARVIVWADNEKGLDVATFRHKVSMEADAMLYIEAARNLPKLLAAFEAVKEENGLWRHGHEKQTERWESGCCGCKCGTTTEASDKTDAALRELEGE